MKKFIFFNSPKISRSPTARPILTRNPDSESAYQNLSEYVSTEPRLRIFYPPFNPSAGVSTLLA